VLVVAVLVVAVLVVAVVPMMATRLLAVLLRMLMLLVTEEAFDPGPQALVLLVAFAMLRLGLLFLRLLVMMMLLVEQPINQLSHDPLMVGPVVVVMTVMMTGLGSSWQRLGRMRRPMMVVPVVPLVLLRNRRRPLLVLVPVMVVPRRLEGNRPIEPLVVVVPGRLEGNGPIEPRLRGWGSPGWPRSGLRVR